MSAVDPNGAKDCSAAIATLADFPVFDATVQHVIALCDDENATTADLVEALECDQSFSANLLRFANSAAQAHPIRAKSIRQAVMLVGRVSLRRLAIKAATFRFLERRGNGGVACGDLHMHAVAVAGCASVAADARGRPRRGGPPRRAAARRRQARPARGVRGGGLRRDRHRATIYGVG